MNDERRTEGQVRASALLRSDRLGILFVPQVARRPRNGRGRDL